MHDDMISPRVFISYARRDGEVFATELRERLEDEEPEITLWQDRARMEGGVGWWKQITDALERVQFLVLIVTPGSLESDVVQKEWRYARQQGVCVYPVNAAPDRQLDFGKMPRWMRSAQFFDLDREWQTFVNYLKSPCHAVRVPFMPPDLPKHLVDRNAPYGRLLSCVLDPERDSPVATTVALHGFGGIGKTTLAAQLCHHDDVITAYTDGILWATLGEKPNILAELKKLYAALTGQRLEFVDKSDAAIELSKRLADRQCLLVIDDVWDSSHLAPFRLGAELCTRLVTTRQFDVAALKADERMSVDEMTTDEATTLLTGYLDAPPPDREPFESLAQQLGEWPLLLELAGGALKQRLARGDTLEGAVAYLNQALDEVGVVAFDQRNPQERHQAVARSISVSLDLLSEDERAQYRALAVFPPDISVPLSTVSTLLSINVFETERVVETLADLSLLQLDLNTPPTLRLHDVMRDYLVRELDGAPALHARLADAWKAPEQLPDAYAWRYAVYHMAAALPGTDPCERHRRTERLVELVTDPAFHKGHARHVADPPALEGDLNRALHCAVEDVHEEAPVLVVRAALTLRILEETQPERLFELAREGKLERAEQLLRLFKPEQPWRQAVLLALIWQAAVAGHKDHASDLLARLRQEIPASDQVLEPLLQHVRSDIELGVAPPPSDLLSTLDSLPTRFGVSQILKRLGGIALTRGLTISGLQQADDDKAPTLLAKHDGPLLVAFAAADPERHTPYLKRYIALQASNPYRHYRNRSLWALIPSIVQHPDPACILDVLRELMTGAVTLTRIDFQSALPLTVLALRASRDDAAALAALEDDRERTVEQVRNLSPMGGEGDPWAHCLRRLGLLAEVYAQVLDRPAEASRLLDEALASGFNYAFAGFRAPACLTLAESLRICVRDDHQMVERALNAALAAAHNIQDPEFCAQMTARVNAMQSRWWPSPPETINLSSTTERFTQNPHEASFAALHKVGDTYGHRVDLPNRLPLPPGMRGRARTLPTITQLYSSMLSVPESEALALNPHLQGPPLPEGTQVNIIDPEFAPLLAARLAAEALVAGGFSDSERASMIQRLVPLSVANRTALDTVAARLLMAAPQNTAALDSLAEAMEEAGVHG